MSSYLTDIVTSQKNSIPAGIVSICTANGFALKAAMKRAMKYDVPVLIEATANQVDQNGGYTGMTPSDFVSYVQKLAEETGFNSENLILGGDHLGPLTRSDLNESEAMDYAEKLVRTYVEAGFTKIHLDTSMRLASDSNDQPLDVKVVAERGARLCKAAEESFLERRNKYPGSKLPVYVIGSEVPIPGGTQSAEESAEVSSVEDCRATFDTYKSVFSKYGLEAAFERVIALVVQTGVEFGDSDIFIYNPEAAEKLVDFGRKNLPIVYEGHSTDYQPVEALRQMIRDGIAFLKVGPALTFALREALFALELIEKEVYSGRDYNPSDFSQILERVMVENPEYWKNHYHGDAEALRFARKYSFSDRARYYLNNSEVQDSISRLTSNIDSADIPMSLLSQFMPAEFKLILNTGRSLSAEDLIHEHIGFCLDDYYNAILP